MPSGLAEAVRRQLAASDKAGLQLERSPYSQTGFKNVIEVKGGKYQARVHAKSDGTRKRRQYSIPGLFESAQEAAEYLALMKKMGMEGLVDEHGVPFRQDKEHKRRKQRQEPVLPQLTAELTMTAPQPQMTPVATVMAVPMTCAMPHAPIVLASPMPLQPLGYTPPFRGI